MTTTFAQISSTTLSADAASITLTLPTSGYSDIHLVLRLKSSDSGTGYVTGVLRCNGESGSVYASITAISRGSTPSPSNSFSQTSIPFYDIPQVGNTGVFSTTYVDILNYRNTTRHKTMLLRSDLERASGGTTSIACGTYFPSGFAALSSLTISASSGNLVSGSSVDVYGITKE
jgi:hypothetical protein